jgi:DNA-binding NtrC family response regulator
MSKILFAIEFGGFALPLDLLRRNGHQVELAKNMRKAIALMNKMQPDLLAAEFNYTSQFRDRDSNLDTILAQIESHSPETMVIAFVEEEQKTHFERLKKRFPQIKGQLYFPFNNDDLLSLVDSTLR